VAPDRTADDTTIPKGGDSELPTVWRVLAVSGSLRAVSANGAVLDALAALAPPGVAVVRFDRLADLPAFNPDLDGPDRVPPAPVAVWRAAVADAQALVVCSPEYAHGVPGALKNALDWLVSGPEVPGLPVAVVNATTRAHIAHASLIETLRTMSAQVVDDACVALPLGPTQRSRDAILEDPAASCRLRDVLTALRRSATGGARLLHDAPRPGAS
jgi:NAD(P)H-dependent FMN reductase